MRSMPLGATIIPVRSSHTPRHPAANGHRIGFDLVADVKALNRLNFCSFRRQFKGAR